MRKTILISFTWLLMIPSLTLAQTSGTPSADSSTRQAGRWTFGVEALVWWFKDSPAPTPLVSTTPLSTPGSTVVLGGEDLDTNPNPGFLGPRLAAEVPELNTGLLAHLAKLDAGPHALPTVRKYELVPRK